jgi:hypothetical protein
LQGEAERRSVCFQDYLTEELPISSKKLVAIAKNPTAINTRCLVSLSMAAKQGERCSSLQEKGPKPSKITFLN